MIEAYCWPQSVAAGEPVALHVSTDTPTFDVEVARDGATRDVVWSAAGVAGTHHASPPDAAANGCGWLPTLAIPTGTDWASGYYAVTVTAGGERADAFAVIRPHPDDPAPILMVLATTTWNAYNDWGGPSLYTGGTRVSFDRPLAPGFLVKPEPHRRKAQPHPDREALWFFEWADPLGLSVWSGGAGWWNWERPLPALGGDAGLPDRRRGEPGPRGASGGSSTATGSTSRWATTSTGRGGCGRPSSATPRPAATRRSSPGTRATGRCASRTSSGDDLLQVRGGRRSGRRDPR